MQWYYANNGQRQGPVAESEFAQLVAVGTITAETLVWRQGMPNWQPYRVVASSAAGATETATAVAGGQVDDTEVCAVSGKRYPRREMIQYEGKWISAEHRDRFFQQLREGVPVQGIGPVPGPFGYAGFWRRFVARLIDGLIMWVVNMGLTAASALFITANPQENLAAFMALQVVLMAVGILLQATYEVFFIRKFDATPGKMALGVKVLRSDGSKLSFWRAVGRYFGQMVSGLILGIGYIMAAFDEEKRALHDRMCDTRVIKTRA